ncbi:hypothetical protein [Pantoea anthophila]|uniref:hypothetical protein n=1 Tax=Pantoea anthophila TaxID=470931 RepID=UPI002DB557EB|nr:hypothetical protein [Pantoea anthophila]MEB5707420.1 hypothetical protein [Pantoea anthophila]MEB6518291.1 hypothetical protein [Pantoea anthophila]
MKQDEVSQLSDDELCRLSRIAASYWAASPIEKIELSMVSRKEWNPINSTEQAIHVAALMDMNICFGDQVVLVSEPAGSQSRTVAYQLNRRVEAMRKAITLLAAGEAYHI